MGMVRRRRPAASRARATAPALPADLPAAPAAPVQPALWRGLPLRAALALGLAASVCLALGRALLAVQSESLTYVRLLGVRLDTRRRCGLLGSSRFLGLRHLQGVFIHEVRRAVHGVLCSVLWTVWHAVDCALACPCLSVRAATSPPKPSLPPPNLRPSNPHRR